MIIHLKNLKVQLIRNDSRNLNYNLRNSVNLIEPMSKIIKGEKTFEYFYSKLINSFVIKRSMIKISSFKLSMFNNINLIFTDFVKKFKNFNLNIILFNFFC